jgi:hypothetical protein
MAGCRRRTAADKFSILDILAIDDADRRLNVSDQWMYFFPRAKGSTVDQLLSQLRDPVFERATGVLQMISRTPDQRRHYDARLKWELNENTRIQTAFEEGAAKGEARGEARGKIELIRHAVEVPQVICHEVLHRNSFQMIGLTISTDTTGDGNLSMAFKQHLASKIHRWVYLDQHSDHPRIFDHVCTRRVRFYTKRASNCHSHSTHADSDVPQVAVLLG